MKSGRPVELRVHAGVARIDLARPETGNRIDDDLARALQTAAETASADPDVRVVLVTAQGPDFCVGGLNLEAARATLPELRGSSAIAAIPQPVVVALQGKAFDQGLELALAADIRLAAVGTRLAMRQVINGGFPFDGGSQRLPRIVGRGLATEMLFTGRVLTGREAERAGLIAEIVPAARLLDRGEEVAREIARRGAVAMKFAKEAIRAGLDLTIDAGMRLEADLSILLHNQPERTEGLEAWRQGRRPRFRRSTR